MNETTVSTGDETQIPTPEAVETPKEEVTTPEVVAEVVAEDSVVETEDESSKALKRMQRRIDKRTADVYRERAAKEQLAQRVAQLEAQSGQEVQPDQSDPRVLAKEIARIERFNEQANSIVSEGAKTHPDYMDALKELAREVGDFVQPNGTPSKFMEVMLEVVDKPSAVLYHLGKNPDLAEELADLSPFKLATRLNRLESELTEKSKPKPSLAPKPLDPVKVRGSGQKDPKDMTDREFAEWRQSQIKQRGFA
jgi:hypothetical protein